MDLFQRALQLHRAGRLSDAEKLYRDILAAQPNHADALHQLGVIARQVGRYDIAIDLIDRAIRARPGDAEAYNDLGDALKSKGEIEKAISAYQNAIRIKRNFAAACNNLGNAFLLAGRVDAAIASFQHGIQVDPQVPECHYNLGNVLKSVGQIDEAVAAYRRTIQLNPSFAPAYVNLATVLNSPHQAEEAIAASRKAIDLNPNLAEAHTALGNALMQKANVDSAIPAFKEAIRLKPDFAEAYNDLSISLKDAGRISEAIAALKRAIALSPGAAGTHSNLCYTQLFDRHCTQADLLAETRRWALRHADPLKRFIQPRHNDRNPARRLRIGYVSPDFRDHCQSFFTIPLLSSHDANNVEIFLYSDVARRDSYTARIQSLADHWRPITGLSHEQAADVVRQDRIDVLIDLTMHMGDNRLPLFARKPAPVQVSWLAYPGSTGVNAIDCRLTDPYLDPPGTDENVYSERSIRLPHTFWCYSPLSDEVVNTLPALRNGYVTFGCLNNPCKINDEVLALWSKVLSAVANSRMLILCPSGLQRNSILEKLGVDPGRIEFMALQPRTQYLRTYHRIDLGLDTFPYNGHTTSLDSFWMGVPVVTLVDPRVIVGRAGWSQLSNLGLTELVAASPEQFMRIAAESASNFSRLAALRASLRQRMESSPLMNAARFAAEFEQALRQMWQSWCST